VAFESRRTSEARSASIATDPTVDTSREVLIVHSDQQNARPVFCAAIGFGNFLLKPGAIVDDIALPGGEGTFQRWFTVDAFERANATQLVSNSASGDSCTRGPAGAVSRSGSADQSRWR